MGKYINSPAVKYLLGLIELVLVAGLLLRFLGASLEAPFVEIIYMLADAIAAPFKNIFPSSQFSWGGVFDMSIFSAIIAYSVFVAIPIVLHQKFEKERPKSNQNDDMNDDFPSL